MHLLPRCQSHIAVWCDTSILCTSPCNFHRILDLQFLLPPGPPLPSIAVPLQCAPVGQILTSSFWLHTLSSTLNNVDMPVPLGNCCESRPVEAFDWVDFVPCYFVKKCPRKKFPAKRQMPLRLYFLMGKSPNISVTTCSVSFWCFFKNFHHYHCDSREPIIWPFEIYRAQIPVWRRKLFRYVSLSRHAINFPYQRFMSCMIFQTVRMQWVEKRHLPFFDI